MKNIIFCCILLLMVSSIVGQNTTPVTGLSKEYYLKKNKTNKIIGWVMMGSGIGAITVGLLTHNTKNTTAIGGYPLQGDYQNDLSNTSFVIGGVAVAGSIPFFIWAGKNKKKAASLAINHQNIILPRGNMLVSNRQPAVSLRIPL